jgi:SAM-dependent methyltransferase
MPGTASEKVSLLSTASHVAIDLTKETEYGKLVAEEIQFYSDIEVCENLFEGGLHGCAAWAYNHRWLEKNIFKTSFPDEVAHQASRHENPRILSLGCGHGGIELQVARRLKEPYEMIAVDLNPSIYGEAQRRADAEGLNITFQAIDLNFADFQPASFDIIYAYASVHHILNLEHLFTSIYNGLKDHGCLVMADLIGKTQVLFWKENVDFTAELVRRMPRRFRPRTQPSWRNWLKGFDPYSILERYVEPSVQVGMEGIRQEEIESLIGRWFHPVKLFKYNAFMRMICLNVYLGNRLDPKRDDDRPYLEELMKLDYQQVQSGKLRPTEMFGVFVKSAA